MNLFCCKRKYQFKFENGSIVLASSPELAIEKLKKSRLIVKIPNSELKYYEFESGLQIEASNIDDAYWRMYLDKRDPVVKVV